MLHSSQKPSLPASLQRQTRVVAFVVLHYLTEALTRKCIDSILRLSHESKGYFIRIVVVDNHSDNGSLEKLQGVYGRDNPSIHFIENNSNLGFSRANNIGYKYATSKWNPDFVIIANNDIEIEQQDFMNELYQVDSDQSAYVIGPDIFCRRLGFHQNPIPGTPSIRRAQQHYNDIANAQGNAGSVRSVRDFFRRVAYRIPGIRDMLSRRATKRFLTAQRAFDGWRQSRTSNIVLQGACLIFTRNFISTGEAPFSPETFLYEEENILAWRFRQNGWPILYTPRLQIIHYNDGATDFAAKARKSKQDFLQKNEMESLSILIRLMSEN
jgi:GT2 family glycosyltransferase